MLDIFQTPFSLKPRLLRLQHLGLLLLAAFCFGTAQIAHAQTAGALAGIVIDTSGAAVNGASVTATSSATGLAVTVTSSASGDYRFPVLSPGKYQIKFTMLGFQSVINSAIVNVSETAIVAATLPNGNVTEQVVVQGDAGSELLQADSSALGRVVDGRTVQELPLSTRNFTQLLTLSPGTSSSVNNAGALGRGTQIVYSNGARQGSNSVTFDGTDAINIHAGALSETAGPSNGVAIPSPEAISEFKVQTGLYDAQYGRNGGANTSLITRSGSNAFHGSIYEFFRNDILNANTFLFRQTKTPRAPLKQNQFGGAIGGPIRHDRDFFFASYQGTRQVNGLVGSTTTSLPVGLFGISRSAAAIGAAYAGQTGLNGGLAIAADGSNISPAALLMLNYKFANGQYMIPSPQSVAAKNNYSVSVPSYYKEDQFLLNLDHQFGEKNHFAVKGYISNQPQLLSILTATVPGFGSPQDLKTRVLNLEDVHIFGPHVVNDLHVGYLRYSGTVTPQNIVPVSQIGVTRSDSSVFPNLPLIAVNGSQGNVTIGYNVDLNQGEHDNTFHYTDTVSITRGKHSLRIGAELRRYQDNFYSYNNTLGSITVYSFPDFLLGRPAGPVASGGNGAALGALSSTTVASTDGRRDDRLTDYTAFLQDDWKATRNLTLNLGLRWDRFGMGVDRYGRDGNFWPALYQAPPSGGFTSAGFVQQSNARKLLPGLTAVNPRLIYNDQWKNFAPRIGFAYQVDPRILVRGGYGIFYERLTNQVGVLEAKAPPNYLKSSLATSDASTFSLANPFPVLPLPDAFPIAPKLLDPFTNLASSLVATNAIDPKMAEPYYQQYLMNVQWEAQRNLLIEVGYVGTKGTKLTDQVSTNQAILASPTSPVNGVTTNTTANRQLRVPFLGMLPNGLTFATNNADSRYNALQVSVTKRLSHGLQFLASYTLSSSVDDNSGDAGGIYEQLSGDQTNLRQAKGRSAFDRPSRFIASFVYDTPRLTFDAFTRTVLSGWELAGVVTLQSGKPYTITDANGASLYGTGTSRASLATGRTMTSAKKSGPITSNYTSYFDTTAFVSAGTLYGNTTRDALRGPGQANTDFSVIRNFSLGGARSFQFRSEFFNLFNHTNFGNPGSEISSGSSFGVISSLTGNPRVIQFGAKIRF